MCDFPLTLEMVKRLFPPPEFLVRWNRYDALFKSRAAGLRHKMFVIGGRVRYTFDDGRVLTLSQEQVGEIPSGGHQLEVLSIVPLEFIRAWSFSDMKHRVTEERAGDDAVELEPAGESPGSLSFSSPSVAAPARRALSMTLRDLVTKLSELPDEHTIYAQGDPPSATSVAESRPRGPIPIGLKYVLEVELAREVVEIWSNWRSGRVPSTDEALEAILYYAKHDTYQPV